MRNFVKIGLIAAAVFFLMAGTAAGLEALGAEWTVPITRTDGLADSSGNVTLNIRMAHFADDVFNNPLTYELGHSIYTTGRYRIFDPGTNKTLPYYIYKEPYALAGGGGSYTLLVSVNASEYSGRIRAEYGQQTYDIKNSAAVAYALPRGEVSYSAIGTFGSLTPIDVGPYTAIEISSMSIMSNGSGSSGSSGFYFVRNESGTWANSEGFWAEAGRIYTMTGRQGGTTWTQTGTYSNYGNGYGDGYASFAGAVVYETGVITTYLANTPKFPTTGYEEYYVRLSSPPARTYYDKLYIGTGQYYINDFVCIVRGGYHNANDTSVFWKQIGPEQVIISGPTQTIMSDIITLTAAVYPTDEWPQQVEWTVPGGFTIMSRNDTSITMRAGVPGTYTITATAPDTNVSATHNVSIAQPTMTVSVVNGLDEVVRLANGSTIYRRLTGAPPYDVFIGGIQLIVTFNNVPDSWYQKNASDNATITVRFNRSDLYRFVNNETSASSLVTNEFRYVPVGEGRLMLNFTVSRNGMLIYQNVSTMYFNISNGTASIVQPAGNDTHLEQGVAGNNSFAFGWSVTPYYMPTILERSMDPSFDTIIESKEYINSVPRANLTAGYGWEETYTIDSWTPGTHYIRIKFMNGTVAGVRTVLVDAHHARGPISFEILDSQSGRPVNNSSITLENDTSKTYWFDTEETPGIIQIPADGLLDSYQASVYADGYATEYLTVAAGNNYTIYLVPDSSSAHIRFSLIDNTGDFPWGSSHLLIKPQFGAVFDPLYFNAAGEAVKQLTIGQNYSLTIVNASGATRDAGFIIPLGNQTIQLVIGDLLLQKTNGSWGNFSYNLQLVRKSANGADGLTDYTAVLNWSRGEGYTGDAYMTITNTNTSAVVDSVNMTSQTGDRVFQIPYTSDLYQIVLRWYDNGTWYEDIRYITPQKALDALAISPTVRNIVCLCLLFIIALVFSQINAQIGAVIILATAAVMYAIGALIITPYVLFCVALIPVVALLGNRYLRGG